MTYTCIDFETANEKYGSACSIGITVFKRGKVVYYDSFLIKPSAEFYRFNPYNQKIHGISKFDVRNAPEFNEIWPKISKYFNKQIIACHNASFDMRVLETILNLYDIPKPKCSYVCTVEIAQKVWSEQTKHRLNYMAELLGIELNHHEAGSDSKACGMVLYHALKKMKCYRIKTLMKKLGLTIKQF